MKTEKLIENKNFEISYDDEITEGKPVIKVEFPLEDLDKKGFNEIWQKYAVSIIAKIETIIDNHHRVYKNYHSNKKFDSQEFTSNNIFIATYSIERK